MGLQRAAYRISSVAGPPWDTREALGPWKYEDRRPDWKYCEMAFLFLFYFLTQGKQDFVAWALLFGGGRRIAVFEKVQKRR